MQQVRRGSRGFTIIELLVVIVVVCILSLLVGLTYNGVQSSNRNKERQAEISDLKKQLEAYAAGTQTYPTLANLSDPAWRAAHFDSFSTDGVADPLWSNKNRACTVAKQPVLASQPTPNCYSYQVTASDGGACDNVNAQCAHYTLTAILEGGQPYVKTSLN